MGWNMNQATAASQKVVEWVQVQAARDGYIAPSLDLFEAGVLDSIAFLKLFLFIEDELSVAIDPAEMDPMKLRSIEAICAFVTGRLTALEGTK